MSTFGALLKGIALKQASMHMHLNPSCTYEQLRDYLIETLDRQQDLAAQLKLETRYRKEGESLQEFAAAVCCGNVHMTPLPLMAVLLL